MAPGDSEGDLESILSALEAKTSTTEDKVEAYASFTKHLNDDLSFFGLDFTKNAVRIFGLVEKDILNDSETVRQGALQVLGYCLHDVDIIRQISGPRRHTNVISNLCTCIQKTEDKTTCTRALWCLSTQNCPVVSVRKEVDVILQSVEYASSKWASQSVTVEHESVKVIQQLLEQASEKMKMSALQWCKIFLPHLVHPAVKVRENSAAVLESALPILSSQKEIFAELKAIVKSKIAPELKKLMGNENELHCLQVWSSLVDLFGEDLHHGSFINVLLPIVESGFKNTNPEIKSAAFVAWQHLIDNFARNPHIIGDIKRINLIMQVLKISNAKVETVARTKLDTWWHFILKLENKVTNHFDTICTPLLQFCLGGSKPSTGNGSSTPSVSRIGNTGPGASPVTPRLNLTSTASQQPVFESLQIKGCEILAHFMGAVPTELNIPDYEFTLDPLKNSLVTGPTFFLKQASVFISFAANFFSAVGSQLEDGLVYHIWYLLGAHLKHAVEHGSKSDTREVVTNFLSHFQIVVLSQSLPHSTLLRMFDVPSSFPRKVLCSTAYGINGGEKMHGTPALFLTELLLTPVLLQKCCTEEKYVSMFSSLISHGISNPAGSLEYSQCVLQILSNNSQFIDKSDVLYKLWNAVINPLLEHITKTNEVNQGDALAPKFDAMYSALMFPITHMLITKLSQPTLKTMLKTWSDFYRTFSRLAAMVTNADANISCEDLCNKILQVISNQDLKDPVLMDGLIQLCNVIIDSVDFSSVVNSSSNFAAALSPSKWARRKQKPMGNIYSVILILEKVMTASNSLFIGETPNKKSSISSAVSQNLSSGIVEILTVLFTHVSSSQIISNMIEKLAKPVGDLYSGLAKKSGKVFNSAFQQKLEKLWLDIGTCIQGRYCGLYDTEFLATVSPLLESTFLHPRRSIKNQTIVLWNATFSRASVLTYPDLLKPVLAKVKEKTMLSLPGWTDLDIAEISETPLSQMSQMDSQAPQPHLLGLPSPNKLHGSFMNKVVSPNVKKSPAKLPVIEGKLSPIPVKRKILSVNDMRNEEFVTIKTTPKKKVILTDHQREVMKERKSLPAMYNSLELSQDVSMMSFYSDSQSTQNPTEIEPIVISSQSADQENKSPVQVEVILINNSSAEILEEKDNMFKSTLRKSKSKLSTAPSEDCSKEVEHVSNDKVSQETAASEEHPDEQLNSVNDSIEESNGCALKQNVMQVISDFPPSTTSTSTGSSGSASHEECSKDISCVDDTSKSPFHRSIKSLSQSSPVVKSQIQTRKASSQESPRRAGSSKSPHKSVVKLPPTSLDQWLVKKPTDSSFLSNAENSANVRNSKSGGKLQDLEVFPCNDNPTKKQPRKSSSVSEATIIEDTVSPTKLKSSVDRNEVTVIAVTVIEETQSPTKFNQLHCPMNASVADTPEKNNNTIFLNDSESKMNGHRSLFSDAMDQSETSDSQVIKSNTSSPVLKLKKLSEQEILKYSPKQSGKGISEAEHQTSKAVENLSDKLATVESEGLTHHQHDDFSEIIPLDIHSTSSQGFQVSGDNSCSEPCNVDMKESDANNSLPLYAEDLDDEENQSASCEVVKEYDPTEMNTLKDSVALKHDIENHREVDSSDVASLDDSIVLKSIKHEVCDLEIETLDVKKKGNKKRKQQTPKKLTPQMQTRTKRRKTLETKAEKIDDKMELDSSADELLNKKEKCISSDDEISFKVTGENSQESFQVSSEMNELMTAHEKTPESKSISDVPQRKSTTKKKREEAEKRLSAKKNSFCPPPRKSSSDSDADMPLSVLATSIVKNISEETFDNESEESETTCDYKQSNFSSARKSRRLSKLGESKDGGQKLKSPPKTVEKGNDEGSTELINNDAVDSADDNVQHSSDKLEPEVNSNDVIEMSVDDNAYVEIKSSLEFSSDDRKDFKVKSKKTQNNGSTSPLISLSDSLNSSSARKGRKKSILSDNTSENLSGIQVSSEYDKELKEENIQLDNKMTSLNNSNDRKSEKFNEIDEPPATGELDQTSSNRGKVLSLSSKKGRKKKHLDKSEKTLIAEGATIIVEDQDSQSQTLTPTIATRQKSKVSLKSSREPSPVTTRLRSMAKSAKSKLKSQSPLSLRSGRLKKSDKLIKSSPLTTHGKKHKQPKEVKCDIGKEDEISEDNVADEPNETQNKIAVSAEDVSMQEKDTLNSDSKTEMNYLLPEAKSDDCNKPLTESGNIVKSPIKKFLTKLQETPVKSSEKPKSVIHNYRRFSDSKLNRGYVMLERSKQLLLSAQKQCRRSILKTPSSPHSPFKYSKDDSFHPIHVRHIYSPSCSPSAGILKRRRLTGGGMVNSPSPSTKHRRVSFAEPVIAPKTKSSTEVSAVDSDKMSVTSSSPEKPFVIDTLTQSPPRRKNTFLQKLGKDDVDSQASYKSTLESELDGILPVYPSLTDCQEPVDQILPQLTSSVWSRGLGQLIRAKNIHTIGHLASLTEVEVQNLPIKSPKVLTVKKALQNFQNQNEAKKLKSLKSDERLDMSFTDEDSEDLNKISGLSNPLTDSDKQLMEIDTPDNAEDSDMLPSVDDALSQMSPTKGPDSDAFQDTPDELDKNPYSEELFTKPSLENVLDSVIEEDRGSKMSVGPVFKSHSCSDLLSLINSVEDKSDIDAVKKLGTDEIFQIHQKLTGVMNNVVAALRSKCHSPK